MAISEFERLVNKSMFRIAVQLQNSLRMASPVDTGRLRNSIKVKPAEDGNGLIIFMVDYGRDVEFGTNPHVILPKSKKALAFGKGKKRVVVKKVRHPGTRPNPFIRTTLRTKLRRIILKEIKRIR